MLSSAQKLVQYFAFSWSVICDHFQNLQSSCNLSIATENYSELWAYFDYSLFKKENIQLIEYKSMNTALYSQQKVILIKNNGNFIDISISDSHCNDTEGGGGLY